MWVSAFTRQRPARSVRGVIYLAEFYLPAGSSLAGAVQRARAGAGQATAAGADVAFLGAVFVPQDETCFALYRAGSPPEVTAAGTLAGFAFDRVAGATVSLEMGP